jgi:hypothetical protein
VKTRTCTKCKEAKPFSEFYKDKTRKYGIKHVCKPCYKILDQNPKYLARRKQYYIDHPEKRKPVAPAVANAKKMRYRASKLKASPAWRNDYIIKMVYKTAALKTKLTGVLHAVDHIVPLQGKSVCGLHCQDNLQVITQHENRNKSNKYWPDMWNNLGVL